jgi:hypothetical protein
VFQFSACAKNVFSLHSFETGPGKQPSSFSVASVGKTVTSRSSPLTSSVVETGGRRESRYKLPWPGGPEGGRSPTMLHMFLSVPVVSLSVDCTN